MLKYLIGVWLLCSPSEKPNPADLVKVEFTENQEMIRTSKWGTDTIKARIHEGRIYYDSDSLVFSNWHLISLDSTNQKIRLIHKGGHGADYVKNLFP